jgi:pSer/pThr/pTyr-binding forkhead associated (FHA) protein
MPRPPEKNLQFAATQQGSLSSPPPARGSLGQASPAPAPVVSRPAVSAAPAPAVAASAVNACPSCGNPVPPDFKFCGTCGHRMTPAAAAAAPAVAAPAPAPVAAVAARPSRGTIVVINPDGSEGDSFPLADGNTTIGREAGAMFAADAYLSPVHATFSFAGSVCSVKDEGSLNGVYVKLKRDTPVRLQDGDIFRIGQEILRYEVTPPAQLIHGVEPMGSPNPGYVGRLSLVIGRESTGNAFAIPADGMHLGRERGEAIFPDDGYVSGLHCRVHNDGQGVVLTDVGSSNGTFLRIRGQRQVISGDLLLMGQQLFRVQF